MMIDESARVAVSLRLDITVCLLHSCRWRSAVQCDGLHGLNGHETGGRHVRHSELSTIINRSLTSINHPSILEPVGMTRSHSRSPDPLPNWQAFCLGCNLCGHSCLFQPNSASRMSRRSSNKSRGVKKREI